MNSFVSNQEMQMGLAKAVAERLQQALDKEGSASMALSGGSTPKPLFALLADWDLDWAKVTITLVDDRWVASDHPDSNEKLVRDLLLRDRAAKARFVGLKNSATSPFAGERECHRRLHELKWPLDVVILGMGLDGHTASLFPCSEQLPAALSEQELLCKAVEPGTAPHPRMTMTLKALLNCRQIFIQFIGQDKRVVFDAAREPSEARNKPIGYFLRQREVPVAAYWAP